MEEGYTFFILSRLLFYYLFVDVILLGCLVGVGLMCTGQKGDVRAL